MSPTPALEAPIFFSSPAGFRDWLERNASAATELKVGFYKVGSGLPSMTWPESVDEALCVGWIDGIRKRIDGLAYQIRFTPRKRGSIWSTVNIKRVEALIAEGRMKPAGLAAFEQRIERNSSVYAYEQEGSLNLTPGELKTFKKNKGAWACFEKAAPSYRRTMIYWVVSPKQEATRARRLAKLIESCAAGVRLLP
jgi:uncharacterized protein YdeI (YjbR/CyaY-like superfamily)